MSKKVAAKSTKAARRGTRKPTAEVAKTLPASERSKINGELDRRLRLGDVISREQSLIGRESMSLLVSLIPRIIPDLKQRVRDFERTHGRLPDDETRNGFLRHTLDAFVYGFRVATAHSQGARRVASKSGANATAAKAAETRSKIVEAYRNLVSDESLNETQRRDRICRELGVSRSAYHRAMKALTAN